MVGEYYVCATDFGDITINNLSANDPDGIGSYTITSQLFGLLSSGTGQLPTSVTIPESAFRGNGTFEKLDEIVIEVSDNHPASPKKSHRVVKLAFGS